MKMFKRQKVLLYLISQLRQRNKRITKTYLDKLLFLLNKETDMKNLCKFYNFFPYNYGPFSNQYYFDLSHLTACLTENFELRLPEEEVSGFLNKNERAVIDSTIEKFCNADIVEYVYVNYPQYTKKSLLKTQKTEEGKPGVFSIGYEGKDIDLFLDLLIQNNITVLVDVRFNPFSMNFPFTKTKLSNYLIKVGIEYLHIPELGINGVHRKELGTNSDYEKLFAFYKKEILPRQADKVESLFELGKKKRIALMCFEQDKDRCHRGIVSESIENMGMPVIHL
jgi:uncharacterized protein (DUF488 family)